MASDEADDAGDREKSTDRWDILPINVPLGFELPSWFRTADPQTVADALTILPLVYDAAVVAIGDQRDSRAAVANDRRLERMRQSVQEKQERISSLIRQLEEEQAAREDAARGLAGPMIDLVRDEKDREIATLRTERDTERERAARAVLTAEGLEKLRTEQRESRAEEARSREREMSGVRMQLSQLESFVRGSNAVKGAIGEGRVLRLIQTLCPDSVVEDCAKEPHRGDGTWTRHFGSAHLSMHCMLEVKHCERIRAEEMTKFYSDLDRRIADGSANCAMFVSVRSTPLPASGGRARYSSFLHLEWRKGVPVLMVSNVDNNPDLLSAACAVMQHVWLFSERKGLLTHGASNDGDDSVEARVQLLNNFVNEQFELHTRQVREAEKAVKQLTELLADAETRSRVSRRQLDNIGGRLAESFGDWVELVDDAEAQRAPKRRRKAAPIPWSDMTEEQRSVVSQCVQWVRNSEGRALRAAAINAGDVPGVTKHHVESLFGGFSTLKLTVGAAGGAGGDATGATKVG